jgi:hypothetical protein
LINERHAGEPSPSTMWTRVSAATHWPNSIARTGAGTQRRARRRPSDLFLRDAARRGLTLAPLDLLDHPPLTCSCARVRSSRKACDAPAIASKGASRLEVGQ